MINEAACLLVQGHGIASGRTDDNRFPDGTLAMQAPFFLRAGLDLSTFHRGTLNLALLGHAIEFNSPTHSFRSIKWSKDLRAENFSFFSCDLRLWNSDKWTPAFLYWPHPSTKPEFHQPEEVYEFIAPNIPGVSYGDRFALRPCENSFYLMPENKK